MKKTRDRSSPESKRPMTRSEMMARIGPKDTKPETVVRRGLHAVGFRFRLHRKGLPGRPDLALPRHRVAIFCHGCFWHAHEGCRFQAAGDAGRFLETEARPKPRARCQSDRGPRSDRLAGPDDLELCALRLDPAKSLHLAGAWIHRAGSPTQISGHTEQVRIDGWP